MFGKKCDRCGKKIGKDFGFCPYCGTPSHDKRNEERDYGLLGKDDFTGNFPEPGVRMPFGFNMIFNSLLREVDKQFRDFDKPLGKDTEKMKLNKRMGGKIDERGFKIPFNRAGGISISISTESGKNPSIKVKSFGNAPEFRGIEREIKQDIPEKKIEKIAEISEEKARKISKLPREEAETRVRRLANKIIYEISLPGVKSIKDVVINKLENSIEIKAFAKDRVFFKLFPIGLPIIKYKLQSEKLMIELRPEG